MLSHQAVALLRRHLKVEELDLSGLDGTQALCAIQPPPLSIRGFVLKVAPYLTKCVSS